MNSKKEHLWTKVLGNFQHKWSDEHQIGPCNVRFLLEKLNRRKKLKNSWRRFLWRNWKICCHSQLNLIEYWYLFYEFLLRLYRHFFHDGIVAWGWFLCVNNGELFHQEEIVVLWCSHIVEVFLIIPPSQEMFDRSLSVWRRVYSYHHLDSQLANKQI